VATNRWGCPKGARIAGRPKTLNVRVRPSGVARNASDADAASGPGHILNNHRLTERCPYPLRQDAPKRIRYAAGPYHENVAAEVAHCFPS